MKSRPWQGMAKTPQVLLSALLPWKNCPVHGLHELVTLAAGPVGWVPAPGTLNSPCPWWHRAAQAPSVPPFPSTAPSVHCPTPEEVFYLSIFLSPGSWGPVAVAGCCPLLSTLPQHFGEPKGAAQSELAAGQGLSWRGRGRLAPSLGLFRGRHAGVGSLQGPLE